MVEALRRVFMRPYALNFARCCEIAETVTPSRSARSHTHTSPTLARSQYSFRRVSLPRRDRRAARSSNSGAKRSGAGGSDAEGAGEADDEPAPRGAAFIPEAVLPTDFMRMSPWGLGSDAAQS